MAPHDDALEPPAGIDRDNEKPQTSDVSRRDFLKTVGASGVATTIVAQGVPVDGQAAPAQAPGRPAAGNQAVDPRPYVRIRQEVAENLTKRGIVGYADRLRVQPGETIKFMVSSEQPAISRRHRAPGSRRRQSQRARDQGSAGRNPGQRRVRWQTQVLPLGSYALVPDHPALRISGSFTFTAWIAPTSQRGVDDSLRGLEGVLTKWAGPKRRLWHRHRRDGRLALWITDAAGRIEKLRLRRPLRPWVPAIPGMNQRPQGVATSWYFIAVSFDAGRGRVVLHQDPINDFPFDSSRGTTERQTTIKSIASHRRAAPDGSALGVGGAAGRILQWQAR